MHLSVEPSGTVQTKTSSKKAHTEKHSEMMGTLYSTLIVQDAQKLAHMRIWVEEKPVWVSKAASAEWPRLSG